MPPCSVSRITLPSVSLLSQHLAKTGNRLRAVGEGVTVYPMKEDSHEDRAASVEMVSGHVLSPTVAAKHTSQD